MAAALGLGIGLWGTLALRRRRIVFYNASKTIETPIALQFKDGHSVPFPDIIQPPSTFHTLFTGFLFATAGIFIGGEIGLLTGSISAKGAITRDEASKKRIDAAFRRLKADVMRKQADMIEKGDLPAF